MYSGRKHGRAECANDGIGVDDLRHVLMSLRSAVHALVDRGALPAEIFTEEPFGVGLGAIPLHTMAIVSRIFSNCA